MAQGEYEAIHFFSGIFYTKAANVAIYMYIYTCRPIDPMTTGGGEPRLRRSAIIFRNPGAQSKWRHVDKALLSKEGPEEEDA